MQNKKTKTKVITELFLSSDDKLILQKHKPIYDLFLKSGEIVNFYQDTQNDLLKIFQKRKPMYSYNKRCPACIAEFLVHVYAEFKNEL